MILMFDTSIIIDIQRKDMNTIQKIKELSEIYPNPPVTTFMTYTEFLYGIMNKEIKNKEKAKSFLNKFGMMRPDKETSEILAELRFNYDKQGILIGYPDLFIAAQAIQYNMTLVTKDKHFEKIKELKKIII
jgi:tRNA(fMet)-specific endonuclease VapC